VCAATPDRRARLRDNVRHPVVLEVGISSGSEDVRDPYPAHHDGS
jgi:hypothetical protein